MVNELPDSVAAALAAPVMASDEALRLVASLAQRQTALVEEVEQAERKTKALKAQLLEVEEKQLPDAMTAAGLKSVTTTNGFVVQVAPYYAASISVALRPTVIKWLRDNGHEGLVSREVSVSFGKGQHAKAAAAKAVLEAQGLTVEDAENVNTSSFKALVRELLEDGQPVPTKDLGVYVATRATVKRQPRTDQ